MIDGIMHDSCTAGPLSGWLTASIGTCCDIHDRALDHSYDLGTLVSANVEFIGCVWQLNPILAIVTGLVVCGPLGWLVYMIGPKKEQTSDH